MKEKRCFKVDKLIRDHAAHVLGEKGVHVFTRTMGTAEYQVRLSNKLLEETKEIINAKTKEERIEECADLLEVLYAFSQAHGFSMEQIEAKRRSKRAEKGGFEQQIYSDHVEVAPENPETNYYSARPEDYPEIIPA